MQENKAISLALAAPNIDGILIKPGEVFSFWHLVGYCSEKKGYKMGMTVSSNGPDPGIGGGLCQFTNLLHWMVLHSPTQNTFQFRVSVTDEYLRGALRSTETLGVKFHVKETDSYFQEVGDQVYRNNLVYRSVIDKRTGNEIASDLIIESNAKVLYGRELINADIRPDSESSHR